MGATTDLLVRVKGDTKDVNSKLGALGGGLSKLGKLAAGAALAGGVAVAALSTKGVLEFAGFQKGMQEVFTLMPGISKDAMGAMSDDVLDLSKKMGVLPDKVIPALYQAISAGVPQDSVFEFMETATKAAIGGVTDLETAVDGITSTVNAFGAENITAAKASDLMFTAVRLGKTTMEELSRSLFQVNPIAAGLGVQFGDVTASLAALTAQGVPTSVASTQIRQALVELGKSGTAASDTFQELSGQTFTDFIAAGGDVKGAFDIMKGGADEMGVGVGDLFGSVEAGMAVIALTSKTGSQAFGDAMDAMQNSTGATETAFATMDQGLSRSWDKIKAQGAAAFIQLGAAIAPVVEKMLDWFMDKLPGAIAWVKKMWDDWKPTIERVVAWLGVSIPAAIEILRAAIGKVADGVKWFRDNFNELKPLLAGVAAVIGTVLVVAFIGWATAAASAAVATLAATWPIIAIAAAIGILVAGIIWAYQNLDWFKNGVDTIIAGVVGAFRWFIDMARPIWDGIVEIIKRVTEITIVVVEKLVEGIRALWENHGERIMSTVRQVFNTIRDVIESTMRIIQGIIDVVMGILTGDWDRAWGGIQAIVTGVWDAITALIRGAWELIETIIVLALDLIGNILGTAWNGIKTATAAAWGNVKDTIGSVWSTITGTVSSRLDTLRSMIVSVWNSIKTRISGFMTGIRNTISIGWSGIFNAVSQWLGRVADRITAAFRNLPATIRSFAGMFLNAAAALGRALIQGIVNGLGGIASALGSKLRSGISSAVSSVKSFFGIRSPSKVMEQQIGEPLAAGITGPAGKAIDWTHNLTGGFNMPAPSSGGSGPLTVILKLGEDELARIVTDRVRRNLIEIDLDNAGIGFT